MDIRDRFKRMVTVDQVTACWNWNGSKFVKGYGRFYVDGRRRQAHRVSYELFVGEIPEGLVIDHLCRVRGCVNPAHLEPKTNRENIFAPGSRASAKELSERERCCRGHLLALPNLVPSTLRAGRRACLACNRGQTFVNGRKRRRGESHNLDEVANRYYAQIMAEQAAT